MESAFNGMKYNPSQNTRTHYKAGKPIKKKKDKNIYIKSVFKK